MRMDEEYRLTVALSESLHDDAGPRGVPPDTLEKLAPKATYGSVVSENHRVHGGGECVVCQARFAPADGVRLLPCSHLYHAECIDAWLCRATGCPVCRHDVVPSDRPT